MTKKIHNTVWIRAHDPWIITRPLCHLNYAASHQFFGRITYLNLVITQTLTLTDLRFAVTNLVHLAGDPTVRSH